MTRDATAFVGRVAAAVSLGLSLLWAPAHSVQSSSLHMHAIPRRSAVLMAENRRPGTSAWQITTPSGNHEIEGYASAASINRGGSVGFYVNTIAPTFHIDLYRMGWYGGTGARFMTEIDPVTGTRQPACPIDTRGMVACHWRRSYTLAVPSSWLSGVYLAKLTVNPYTESGHAAAADWQSYIIFVVRDDASASALLFQTSVTTYQAYNAWGGKSLYGIDTGGREDFAQRAYAVSFDRPYERALGAGDFLYWEYPMLRWMEMNGYDVTYDTDLDTDASPDLLRRHKAFLSVGHDEYWSKGMRDNIESALKHGVSLGFFGGNTGFWQIRLAPSALGPRRIIVCYKDKQLDPYYGIHNDLVTVKWRDPLIGRPEQTLMGEMWESWYARPGFPLRPVQTTAWPFAGTGLRNGDSIPGIVGYEYDRVFPGVATPKGLTILAASPVKNVYGTWSTANATLYTAPSGARVFAAGTIEWSWGLDDEGLAAGGEASWTNHHVASAALARLTASILDDLGAERTARSVPVLPATPVVTTSRIAPGGWFQTRPHVTVQTSTPLPAGAVAECSLDGGASWHAYRQSLVLPGNGWITVECRTRWGAVSGPIVSQVYPVEADPIRVDVRSPQAGATYHLTTKIPLLWLYHQPASDLAWDSTFATLDDHLVANGQTLNALDLGSGRHLLQIVVRSNAGRETRIAVPFTIVP